MGGGEGVSAAEQLKDEQGGGAKTRLGSRQCVAGSRSQLVKRLLSEPGIKPGFKKQTHGAGSESEILQQPGGRFARASQTEC